MGPEKSFESKSNNCNDVRSPIHVGILPFKLFFFMDNSRNFVNDETNSGMSPSVNSLSDVWRYRNLDKFFIVSGMVPINSFLAMSRCNKLTSLSMEAGMNPLMKFSCNARNCNFVFSCCIVGISPTRRLPCKSMTFILLVGSKRFVGSGPSSMLSLRSKFCTVLAQYEIRFSLRVPVKPLSSRYKNLRLGIMPLNSLTSPSNPLSSKRSSTRFGSASNGMVPVMRLLDNPRLVSFVKSSRESGKLLLSEQ
mmetsp:Transcript_5094/g.14897  ORF Transcript_5094/g.14897 Transcript_5094/m.14897 type:complete len:250 (-) Transcript_5094:1433-2182(-)